MPICRDSYESCPLCRVSSLESSVDISPVYSDIYMPELPEVESVKSALIPLIVGKTIHHVDVMRLSSFRGDPQLVYGALVVGLSRHGKIMRWHVEQRAELREQSRPPSVIPGHARVEVQNLTKNYKLKTRNFFLNIHLKMSGRFALERTVHTRVVFTFSDGTSIYFNDPRTFGWVKVSDTAEKYHGLDVYTDTITPAYLYECFSRTSRDIKTILLDQSILAGIGNIYACDILWTARISPFTSANNITIEQCNHLAIAIHDIITVAVALQGSSKTWVYRLPDGTAGRYQTVFKVYSREGLPCLRCHTPIQRTAQHGRSTWWCPKCQSIDTVG